MIKTVDRARGKWTSILQALGIKQEYLTGQHCPCPFCGGKDRFRFDNMEGNGTYICSQCGAGDGINFLMKAKGWAFAQAAKAVDEIMGNVKLKTDKIKKEIDPEYRKNLLNATWTGSQKIKYGDPVDIYLKARGITAGQYPEDLRYHPKCRAPNGKEYPTMIAMVRGPDNTPASIHRTFLGCADKADMPEPRAMMSGTLPNGSAIRLSGQTAHIGIAEGIETALCASQRFGIPVWATLNTSMMQKWVAPDWVKRVTIFGDNDDKFGGQAAAYKIAHSLATKGLEVDVKIPETIGTDWAD